MLLPWILVILILGVTLIGYVYSVRRRAQQKARDRENQYFYEVMQRALQKAKEQEQQPAP